MESMDVNIPLLLAQLLNVGILIGWLVLGGIAIWQLRTRHLSDSTKVIWVAVILLVPLFGALAFFFMRPGLAQTFR